MTPIGLKVVVSSTSSSITVPKGTFACYAYSISVQPYSQVLSISYFSPGAGYIKEDGYSTSPGGKTYVSFRLELTALTLN